MDWLFYQSGFVLSKNVHSLGKDEYGNDFKEKFRRRVGRSILARGAFDYFGELSHPDYKDITDEQYNVRMTLREIMTDAGFKPIAEEWWHFTLVDEPYPDTYFTFPVNAASVVK